MIRSSRVRAPRNRAAASALALVAVVVSAPSLAGQFKIPFFGDKPIDAVYNTTLIGGMAVRAEPQDASVIAKNDLNPEVCGRGANGANLYQSCQGLFTTQGFLAKHLADAPGTFSNNFDHGDLNYKQWDLTQSLIRLNQDITLTWHDWTLFAKAIAIYDPTNYNFNEIHPNLITPQNASQVGYATRVNAAEPGSTVVGGARIDSAPCPANRNPGGGPCGIVYGPGGRVVEKRSDSRVLRQIGLGLQLLDLNITGSLKLLDHDVALRVGRQQVIWGEATVQFFDSINVLNPPDLNNFFRVGGNGLDDFYQPVNAISFGTTPTDNLNVSGWYAMEFRPIELPAYGGFYSPVNLGTNNEGPDYVTVGFGNLAPDSKGIGRLLDNPLSLITNTTSHGERLRDDKPSDFSNNFGVKLAYTADWLNNGTNLGLYYANYTSRVPMVSVTSADEACSKHSTSTATFALDCPDIPLFHALGGVPSINPADSPLQQLQSLQSGLTSLVNSFLTSPTGPVNDPAGATSSALALDSLKFRLEYPRNIEMLGFSFNTSFGDVSFQGEAAYRPRDPLQIDLIDLAFAGLGPTLTNCHLASAGCSGSNAGVGVGADGNPAATYLSSNFTNANGVNPYPDTFDLLVGHLPGSGRSFPNFIIPYRGGTIGLNAPNTRIQGWETFQTLSLDFGATYVEGNTDFTARMLHADQVIWLPEIGFRGILNLPPLDRLALAVPGTSTSPTAGADGSGADGSRQACSTNTACQFGQDGLRFNPHQAPLGLYPTEWSGGVGLVWLIRWESVVPGISINPQFIIKHDIFGHSPGYLSNYVQGRTLWDSAIEFRYRDKASFNVGYQMWSGGGAANLFRDRDTIKVFAKYSF